MKYPRTYHLTFSPGATNDDKKLNDDSCFLNKEIIITSKMDGSNVCLTSEECFARSHSKSPKHLSFDLLKQIHSNIKKDISPNFNLFGEYLFAKHAIHYSFLPSYLMIFGIVDIKNQQWLSWQEVSEYCEYLKLETVPQLFKGSFSSKKELEIKIKSLALEKEFNEDEREGVVIRNYDSFSVQEFSSNCAKYVRANHVACGSEHWKNQKIIKNKLKCSPQ